jgi:hypothetical protein
MIFSGVMVFSPVTAVISWDSYSRLRGSIVHPFGVPMAAGSLLDAHSARAAAVSTGVADLTNSGTPFPHVWERVVGGDWAKQALRRDYQDQLLEAQDGRRGGRPFPLDVQRHLRGGLTGQQPVLRRIRPTGDLRHQKARLPPL